jgi:hypothetical protein
VKPGRIEQRPSSCGGYELHWSERKPGESLQGWYRTPEEAASASALLVRMGLAVSS